MIDGFMTVGELATELGVHEGQILWCMHRGSAPPSETAHGRTIFPSVNVMDWFAQSRCDCSSRLDNSSSNSVFDAFAMAPADEDEAARA